MFGIVLQEPVLFDNTLRYNLAYRCGECTDQQIQQACELSDSMSFITKLSKRGEFDDGM